MRDIPTTLHILNTLGALASKAEAEWQQLRQSPLPEFIQVDYEQRFEAQIAQARKHQRELLNELVHFPPHCIEHAANIDDFHLASPYEKSVFIMTKFPDGESPRKDEELSRVIKAAREAVTKCGFVSHVASDRDYDPMLWKNVEVYLLACCRGIAIVESKHTHELNPNVTMEWGWMRATDRRVLFLVEKTFDRSRADLSGLITDPFDWDNPEPDIEVAVKKFLTSAKPSPKAVAAGGK